MTDVEALMWALEKDPHLSASIANVTVFDRLPDPERLRRRMARALQIVPRLRQRVVPGLGRLAPPEWADDPDVDLSFHIRHLALPAPGSLRQLLDLAAVLYADPFDRTRPLWEFVLVDGLEGGRGAMVQKLHHTVTDGEGGVRMSEQFVDLARDAPDPPPVDVPVEPAPDRGIAAAAAATFGHGVRRMAGVGGRTVSELAGMARSPGRLVATAGAVADAATSLARQVVVTERARSPLWTERSLRRRIEVLRVPLDEARRSSKALGGSINDFFVAGAAGGAGAYHRAFGAEVDELRISMPVSTRTDRSAGGNAFTPARVLVPAGIEDPVERFTAVHERLGRVKGEPALDLAEALAGVVALLPTSVLVRAARSQVETVDFTASNVRGAPFDLYIAGGKILANYPIGPTAGTAFNLTLLSSGGNLDMAAHVDTVAVEDPELLRRCLEGAYEELLAAGR
jgi:diacylglycerol O-acyltransferase / wax synthase